MDTNVVFTRDSSFIEKLKSRINCTIHDIKSWIRSFKSIDYESNLVKHAISEFKYAGWLSPDVDESQKWIMDDILKLLTTISRQGHSGFSINYCIDHFINLAKFGIISPLEDKEDQWSDVSSFGGGTCYQNKRLSSVFKDIEDDKAYYLDAILWREVGRIDGNGNIIEEYSGVYSGRATTNNGESISSCQYIKFPFYPKSFYVDVINVDARSGYSEYKVKDESQLTAVFEYYNKRLVK